MYTACVSSARGILINGSHLPERSLFRQGKTRLNNGKSNNIQKKGEEKRLKHVIKYQGKFDFNSCVVIPGIKGINLKWIEKVRYVCLF